MSKIKVSCDCGQTFKVPPTHLGRKLQCKRCGQVVRLLAPADSDITDSSDDTDLPIAAPIMDPIPASGVRRRRKRRKTRSGSQAGRRCPSCEAEVAARDLICLSCGHDFRTGDKLPDQSVSPEQRLALTRATSALARLETLGWWALTPLGILLGPFVLLRSITISGYDRELRKKARATFREGLTQVRVVGVLATVIWVTVGVIGALKYGRPGRTAEPAPVVRGRADKDGTLRDLASAVRRFVKDRGDFPKRQGTDADTALAELIERGFLEDRPRFEVRADFRDPITKGSATSRWLFWTEDDSGPKPRMTVVTLGGSFERYERADFPAARRRVFGSLPGEPTPVLPGEVTPDETPDKPAGSGKVLTPDERDALYDKVRAVAGRVPKTISRADLETELGTNCVALFTDILADRRDVSPRTAVLDLLLAVELEDADLRRLASYAEGDTDEDLRMRAARVLRRLETDGWLVVAMPILRETTNEENRGEIERWLTESATDAESIKRIVSEMTAVRIRDTDPPLFEFPAPMLKHVVPLLFDKSLHDEAERVLLKAGDSVLPVIEDGFVERTEAQRLTFLDFLLKLDTSEPKRVLDLIVRRLQEPSETINFRKKALEGLGRFIDPIVVRIAAQQYDEAPSILKPTVKKLFREAVESAQMRPALITALDSKASELAEGALQTKTGPALTASIAKAAGTLSTSEARLAMLRLVRRQVGADVHKICAAVVKDSSDEKVCNEVLGILVGLPTAPLDKDLIKVVNDIALDVLGKGFEGEFVHRQICKLLENYQTELGRRRLMRFAKKPPESIKVYRRVIEALKLFYDFDAVELFAKIADSDKYESGYRKIAVRALVTSTAGIGQPDWKTYLRTNRRKVEERLDGFREKLEEKNKRLQKKAEDAREKRRS